MISFKDKILNHNSEYDPLSWKKFKELSASNATKRELGRINIIWENISNSPIKYLAAFLVVVALMILLYYSIINSIDTQNQNKLEYDKTNTLPSKILNNKDDSIKEDTYNIKLNTISKNSIKESKKLFSVKGTDKKSLNQSNLDKAMILNAYDNTIDKRQVNKIAFFEPQNKKQKNNINTYILSDKDFNKNDNPLNLDIKSNTEVFHNNIQNIERTTITDNSISSKLHPRAIFIKANRESILHSPSIKLFKNKRYISFLFGAGFGIIQNREYDVFPNYTYGIYGRRYINQKFYLATTFKYNRLYLGEYSETIKEDNNIVSTLQFVRIKRKQLSNSLSLGYHFLSSGIFIEGGILFHLNLSYSMTGTKIDRLNDIIISKVDLSKVRFGSSFGLGYTVGLGYIKHWKRYHIKTELKYNSESPSTPGIKTNFKVSRDNISLTFGFGYLIKI